MSPSAGERVTTGDSLYGGGGYSGVDAVERLVGADAADVLAGCIDNGYGEITVVNNLPDGIGARSSSRPERFAARLDP